MTSKEIQPVRRSISVSWDQETAFKRFTSEFGSWWPSQSHSIGGDRIQRIVFEPQLGGRIYEEHKDGRRFQWGQVTLWDPPNRVKFNWHPARDSSTSQEVEIEKMSVLDAIMASLNLVMKLRGGREREIARAGGEMHST